MRRQLHFREAGQLMQFWSGTPFMGTGDALAIAHMLDECGYDGVI